MTSLIRTRIEARDSILNFVIYTKSSKKKKFIQPLVHKQSFGQWHEYVLCSI